MARRTNPVVLACRINTAAVIGGDVIPAGAIGGDAGGIFSEMADLFTFLTGAPVRSVTAEKAGSRENSAVTIGFADGSVATLTVTSLGAPGYPAQALEVFCDGAVLTLKNDAEYRGYGAVDATADEAAGEGGLSMSVFADALLHGGPWPIPLWQQVQAMKITCLARERLGDK